MDAMMSHQIRRLIRIAVILAVVAIVINDGYRLITATSSAILGARDGLDAAGSAVLAQRKGLKEAQAAAAARGAQLVAYDMKRTSQGVVKTAAINMTVRATAPGMIVVGPIWVATQGVPMSQWWSVAPAIDWNAQRKINLTTGMTIS